MSSERNEDTGIDTGSAVVLDRGPDRRATEREPLTVTTLFIAFNVRDYLDTDDGRDTTVEWCEQTGIEKVFLDNYRDPYRAERETLVAACERFSEAGIETAGCVAPTAVGRSSSGLGPLPD